MHFLEHSGPPLRTLVSGQDGQDVFVEVYRGGVDGRPELLVVLRVFLFGQPLEKVLHILGQRYVELQKGPEKKAPLLHAVLALKAGKLDSVGKLTVQRFSEVKDHLGMPILFVTPENPLFWAFLMQNFNLGIA